VLSTLNMMQKSGQQRPRREPPIHTTINPDTPHTPKTNKKNNNSLQQLHLIPEQKRKRQATTTMAAIHITSQEKPNTANKTKINNNNK